MYFKPERIKGEDYSVHSEVWSLGVSLFEVSSKYCIVTYCTIACSSAKYCKVTLTIPLAVQKHDMKLIHFGKKGN